MRNTLKKHLFIHYFLFWAAAAVAFCSVLVENSIGRMAVALLAGAVLILAIFWRLHFVKCPFCGTPLLGSRRLPDRCPGCGRKIINRKV